jgi:Uncharacterized conserved protein
MDKKINRRQFIGGVGAGIVTLGLSGCNILNQSTTKSDLPTSKPSTIPTVAATPTAKPAAAPVTTISNLVVAEGKDPDTLIKNGLKALGGIGEYVKKGASVVIKPNFSVIRSPEEAATTNPQLVAAVVKECLKAGAKEVKVIDYPFMSPICLTKSGIKDAVEKAGGKAYTINSEDNYKEVNMGGVVLKEVLYSKDVLEADVLINMPILKHHHVTRVTMGLKNMMGLVYDRDYFHRSDLNQGIAELTAFRKPDLIIMDAIRGIIENGPIGPGEIKAWNQVIFGVDPLAVDTYAADLFGVNPSELPILSIAYNLGVGQNDLKKIKVQKV